MKKIIFILIAGSLLFCSSEDKTIKKYITTGESFITEGWTDSNTYRVVAIGFPNKSETDKYRRRIMAKEGALMNAQKIIIERFKGVKISGQSVSEKGEVDKLTISKTFEGIFRGGSIINEIYDESDNCQIVYEIYSPGLRERVTSGIY